MHYPPLRRLYRTRRLVIGAAQSMVRQTRRPGNRKGREKPLMPTQIADVGADALLEAKSTLDSDYIPREDEPFMNERQQEYFRGLLIAWKKTILTEAESTLAQHQDGPPRQTDLPARASSETDWAIELRTRDRQQIVRASYGERERQYV